MRWRSGGVSSRLTMNGAADKLIRANDELRDVIENWDEIPDSIRYARIRQVQWDLANAITPAANWKIMAEIDDVIIVPVRKLIAFLRQLGNNG
jgi:hypothetical protein